MGHDKALTHQQKLNKAAQDARLKQQGTVLAQPHRRGDDGDLTDALGTFVRHQHCGRLCWEAGQLYIRLVAKYRRAKGIPQRVFIEDETPSSGGSELLTGQALLDFEKMVRDWEDDIKACENAMKCSGLPGFRAANNLVLEDIPPPRHLFGPVKRAITQLAICLGLFTE